MDAIGIARTGLQASMARLTTSAANIANAGVAGAGSKASSGAGSIDIASALVDQVMAKQDFLANLSVIETVSKLEQSTIERWG